MKFHKYHALGNDYLVVEPGATALDERLISAICDRHRGLGSDGILVGERGPSPDEVTVRIFNPDGSEAEKSGNGLRIFARYAWERGLVAGERLTVVTRGGPVRCEIRDGGRTVFAEMGQAVFASGRIPVAGAEREVIDEALEVGGESVRFTAVSVGNPHCVVHRDEVTPALARRLGPALERHPLFPRRINVQLVQVLGPRRLGIEIWERGAGYTLASGTSACAAAAASVRLGRCPPGEIAVAMAGGTLVVGVSETFALTLLGPVAHVAEGVLSPELGPRP